MPEFEYLKDNQWLFTEKVNGTNIRIGWDGEKIEIGGRTDKANIPVFLLDKLLEIFKNEDLFLKVFGDDPSLEVCLYGEGYGAKIQGGGGNYKPDGVDFALFDVRINGWFLVREDVEKIAERLDLKTVPVIGKGTLTEAINKTKNGFTSAWGNFLAEGIVARPEVELKTRRGDRIIVKLKTKDFL